MKLAVTLCFSIVLYSSSFLFPTPDAHNPVKPDPLPASAQQPKIDPAFFGFWNLEVARSDFGGQPSPKSGQVDWGDHGWAFALVLADGGIFTDAVATDQGCAYIGPSVLSCEYEVVTPRHVRITMKLGKKVIRVGDIELIEQDVTQTTHRVTPSDGPPYARKPSG
jgi:hypothetical protein